jgi:hypothetical protein
MYEENPASLFEGWSKETREYLSLPLAIALAIGQPSVFPELAHPRALES